MKSEKKNVEKCLERYRSDLRQVDLFADSVKLQFSKNPKLNQGDFPILHSVKSRVKDVEHLRQKIVRKIAEGKTITPENLYSQITDLAGVRLFHLYQEQFVGIHEEISRIVETEKQWVYSERPVAYTWDRESIEFYKRLKLKTSFKDSYYTSIHYVVRANRASEICCEIQVRTLFEEIWGEIDHQIRYPERSLSVACKEQLRVLAKLVNAGTRLADSIIRCDQEYGADGK